MDRERAEKSSGGVLRLFGEDSSGTHPHLLRAEFRFHVQPEKRGHMACDGFLQVLN